MIILRAVMLAAMKIDRRRQAGRRQVMAPKPPC
jgi:hypothetical protein